jgi:hypothetical protein
MAIVQDQTARDMDDIIEEMDFRGSTVTKEDIISVVEGYHAVIAKFLADGDRINTPLFRTSASISGVFEDGSDDFDRERHYVRLNVNPGPRIAEISEELSVEKVEASKIRPVLQTFRDYTTESKNDTVTPGEPAELKGSHLKVDPEADDQGIFFIASDDTETKVQTIMRNMPSNLIFMVPEDLASGEYELEVRTVPKNYNAMRTGKLDSTLVSP